MRFVPNVRVPPCAEPCLVWSERTWERFTDTLTLRSAAWRCMRSTRPEEPATSFAFLQPLLSMRSQPIRATKESSGGGTNAFKVVRRIHILEMAFHLKYVWTKSNSAVFSHLKQLAGLKWMQIFSFFPPNDLFCSY